MARGSLWTNTGSSTLGHLSTNLQDYIGRETDEKQSIDKPISLTDLMSCPRLDTSCKTRQIYEKMRLVKEEDRWRRAAQSLSGAHDFFQPNLQQEHTECTVRQMYDKSLSPDIEV